MFTLIKEVTLMMTSAQVVETSVNVINNSPSRDYSHPDDQTTQTTETPGFQTIYRFNKGNLKNSLTVKWL